MDLQVFCTTLIVTFYVIKSGYFCKYIMSIDSSTLNLFLFQVMYFLFKVVDHEKAKQEFRDCWPVLDKKQVDTLIDPRQTNHRHNRHKT